ncbi:MAG TPA: nitroreductase family protein, partial [Candidatus Krumholzibacteria bacterium]|nr:nitroreductase family protein [Candidatus Krumholzibacteria bacterium]
MDLFDAVAQRRSVKKFDPSHAMTEAEIASLFEAVILSPTSYNIQNWRFVLVTDPERKAALRAAG